MAAMMRKVLLVLSLHHATSFYPSFSGGKFPLVFENNGGRFCHHPGKMAARNTQPVLCQVKMSHDESTVPSELAAPIDPMAGYGDMTGVKAFDDAWSDAFRFCTLNLEPRTGH